MELSELLSLVLFQNEDDLLFFGTDRVLLALRVPKNGKYVDFWNYQGIFQPQSSKIMMNRNFLELSTLFFSYSSKTIMSDADRTATIRYFEQIMGKRCFLKH